MISYSQVQVEDGNDNEDVKVGGGDGGGGDENNRAKHIRR